MKRQRFSAACQNCRHLKLRCNETRPCHSCIRAGVSCDSDDQSSTSVTSSISSPQSTMQRGSHHDNARLSEFSTVGLARMMLSATGENRENGSTLLDDVHRRIGQVPATGLPADVGMPLSSFMGEPLPSRRRREELIDIFFTHVDWFMMIIPQSLFRTRYDQLLDSGSVAPGEENFAWLVTTVLALAAFYDSSDITLLDTEGSEHLAFTLLRRIERSFLDVINVPNIEAIQVCILLGSFHLYNRKTNSGFGILGSAVKLAQNLGLHRKGLFQAPSEYAKQSWSRTWCALEVFDKNAAAAFGRPCIIDDSDCDVEVIEDDPTSSSSPYYFELSGKMVSLITYHQREFMLYRIMGPCLRHRTQANSLESLVLVHRKLVQWSDSLPQHLRFTQVNDSQINSDEHMYELLQLQALSLQLAYDNLQITLHRWVLHDRTLHSQQEQRAEQQLSISQLIESAVRISSLANPTNLPLIQKCRATHAAMHTGLCFFAAGVVLCAVVLRDLSAEHSQNARHGIRNIIQLNQSDSGRNHILASQDVKILEQLVNQIACADRDFLLGKVATNGPSPHEQFETNSYKNTPSGIGIPLLSAVRPFPEYNPEGATNHLQLQAHNMAPMTISGDFNAPIPASSVELFAGSHLQTDFEFLDSEEWQLQSSDSHNT